MVTDGVKEIADFIEQIIDEQGYTTLDTDAREILKVDLTQRLMDQIDKAAINALSEEQAIALADMVDNGASDAEVQQFMRQSGVNLSEIAMTTMLQFKMLYAYDVSGGAGDGK